ncbi:hypothetical protein P9112_006015 [Eukaryota sp. TZLM1-RC]
MANVSQLLEDIKRASFSDDKVKVLTSWLSGGNACFMSSSDVSQLIKCFSFSDDKMTAIKNLSKHYANFTEDDVLAIINSLSFSDDKMKALKILAQKIWSCNWNIEPIINLFSFSDDKDKARSILNEARNSSQQPANPQSQWQPPVNPQHNNWQQPTAPQQGQWQQPTAPQQQWQQPMNPPQNQPNWQQPAPGGFPNQWQQPQTPQWNGAGPQQYEANRPPTGQEVAAFGQMVGAMANSMNQFMNDPNWDNHDF